MLTDRLSWFAGCLLVPLFLNIGLTTADNDAKGFLITGPKQVLPGSVETYCLHLKGIKSAGKVYFNIAHNKYKIYVGSPGVYRIDPKINDYNKCIPITLNIPASLTSGTYEAAFQIDWDDASETLKSFTKREIIVSSTPRNLLLIQTDKQWYTPGQLVRFRTLALTHVFKPILTPPKKVWVTDPKKQVVFEWTNVTTNLGLIQLELQLSPEAAQGVWKIHVETDDPKNYRLTQTKKFEVKNFVLPTFEVKIDSPKSVVGHEETFDLSVCAKSIAGEPVQGTVDLVGKLQPRMAWFGPITSDADVGPVTLAGELEDGCLHLSFPLSRLAPEGELWSNIEITGHVTQAGTGEKRNASITVSVGPQGHSGVLFEISSQNSFQIGLPYVGQGRVVKSGEALANAEVHICVQEGIPNVGLPTGYPVLGIEAIVCHDTFTDEKGTFKYSVLPRKPDTVLLTFQFTHIDVETNTKSTQLITAKASHSLSGSFASISATEQPMSCDSKLALKVYFNNVKAGEKLDLHYIVTGRGDVLGHGAKSAVEVQTFEQELHGIINLPKKSFDEKVFNLKSPVKLSGVELEIQVTPSFYPKASVLVYYVREDGEVVAAQTDVNVKECFPNPVTLHWSGDHAAPGATAKLNVQSTPGSLCGLSVVDQSVTLVKPDGQLTEKKLFAKMGAFVIEPFFHPSQHTIDYHYCWKSDPAVTKAENITGNPEGTWSSSSVHEDVIQAFDRAGLMVISNLKLQTRPCYSYFTKFTEVELDGIPYRIPHLGVVPRETEVAGTEETVPATPLVEEHVYFPDTLLWDLRTVDENGSLTIEEKLPKKATSWVGRALCLSETTGFGLSAEAKITAA